jgi:hypothetical protein
MLKETKEMIDSITNEIKTLKTQLIVACVFVGLIVLQLIMQLFSVQFITMEPISLTIGAFVFIVIIKRLKSKIHFQKVLKSLFD